MLKVLFAIAIIGVGFSALDKIFDFSKPKQKPTITHSRYEDYFIDGDGIITYTKIDKYV
jgi:hypothetical protein